MTEMTVRPLDSRLVMAYIQQTAIRQGIFVNATKLQKLMYVCYGVCLTKFHVRLCDETPSAWMYGPVFPKALRELRTKGLEHYMYVNTDEVNRTYPELLHAMVKAALNVFGRYTATQLVEWTQRAGSPWTMTSNGGRHLYRDIADELTVDYFRRVVVKSESVSPTRETA